MINQQNNESTDKNIRPLSENNTSNLFVFQTYKKIIIDLNSKLLHLQEELRTVRNEKNYIFLENKELHKIIAHLKVKEEKLKETENILKSRDIKIENLQKDNIDQLSKFIEELNLKDSIYNYDVMQTKIQQEFVNEKVETFNKIAEFNKLLYSRILALEKELEDMKIKEKMNLELTEFSYMKKLDDFKQKVITVMKKERDLANKLGNQEELNYKLALLQVEELVDELQKQSIYIKDLLDEREKMKNSVACLLNDLKIFKEVSLNLANKNLSFKTKLEKMREKIVINKNNDNTFNLPSAKMFNKFEKIYNTRNNSVQSNNIILKEVDSEQKSTCLSNLKNKVDSKKQHKEKVISMNKEVSFKNNNSSSNNDYNVNLQKDYKIYQLFKEKEKYKDLYIFHKDKNDSIQKQFSNIIKAYDEVLEKIYNENFAHSFAVKESYNIDEKYLYLNLNDFKEYNFEKMSPTQKYAILVKLINNISPIIYKNDFEKNLFINKVSKVKQKYSLKNNEVSKIFNNDISNQTPRGLLNSFSTRVNNSSSNTVNSNLILNFDDDKTNMINPFSNNGKKNKGKSLLKFDKSKNKIERNIKYELFNPNFTGGYVNNFTLSEKKE